MNRQTTIYVFIDASNVWNAVKSVKKFIEYKKLKDYLKSRYPRVPLRYTRGTSPQYKLRLT